jgi:hypothetical protein
MQQQQALNNLTTTGLKKWWDETTINFLFDFNPGKRVLISW